ncbi:circadian clock-controlled protein daywake-like [Vanessa atalanta]|uniref:circadian clock-controlled protein daywake-like n=1 Tax=Vanessa atalanta TaxID=42275 RepID=UPI001FCCF498|nr:circadian clock-controlled protein daywake-like [Vanessa atalanta]
MKYLIAIVFLVGICHVRTEDDFFPDYIQPCDLKEEEFTKCVKQQIEDSLPHFSKGIPELGVPSVDPVNLDDITIDGNGLKLKFNKAQMHGLSHTMLTKLKVDIGQEDERFNLGIIANLSLTAKYNADGKILILPIKGDGDAVITCKNIEVEINSKLSHIKSSKGLHFKLVTPNYKYDIQSTTFEFENLFNGNKQLADATLQFANENWRQLMDDLAPPVVKQIVKTIVKAINKFFSKVTINRIVNGYKQTS